ncbi:hypothetical protein [Luteimonas terrae]|uniref:His-Xaa-Ser system protein HxsD n=1 Tax=Luteimonas terrae TaxID=1530191 RepID=A0ABU1XX01_9GAMM|nr:hypothetical protein [Luteimonas terrae]MDR7193275.1 His-Xaa-Ser system protein HxsD [Luteimonas terrae]
MDGSTIWFDRSFFSDEVIARTAHRYTNFFQVTVHGTVGEIGVELEALQGVERSADLEARFRNDALDERLRETVRKETKDLHAELIRAALRESLPRRTDVAP